MLVTVEDNPEFVDSGNDDYNLKLTSPAIDFCDFAFMQGTDYSNYFAKNYNGNNRAYILSSVIYPIDLGAIEYSNGPFTGQSDLKLSVIGDTTSSLNANIQYVFNVDNLGAYTSDQATLTIQLDENTGNSWVDINPQNSQDWNCVQCNKKINCFVNRDFQINRVVSPVVIDVSADVIDVTTTMSATFSDYRSLDSNTSNNDITFSTVITGVNDVIFKNGFNDL